MSAQSSFSGKTLNGPHQPPRTYKKGRVCADRDCDTRLSIYNESRYCSLHATRIVPRLRGRRAA